MRQRERFVAARPAPAGRADIGAEIACGEAKVCVDAGDLLDEPARRLGIAHDRGPSRAKDAGLLAADAVAVVAEPVLMIDVDRRDDRSVRVDEVDRIEPAAEADFEQRDVELRVGEQHQRGERAVFEVGQRDVAARGLNPFERIDERRVARFFALDAHALVVAQEMRRGIRADALAVRAQHCFEKRNRRALAVGAADRDDGRPRCAEPLPDRANAIQAKLDRARMDALLVVEPVGEVHAWRFVLSRSGMRRD